MRFFYADPGLVNNLGHHANSCRFITREFRARGIETIVLAYAEVEKYLQSELGAIPFFKSYVYTESDNDPICGWLNGFHKGVETTRRDLLRLTDIRADDLFYLNSARPIQLMAVAQWLSDLNPSASPRALMEFGTEPGVDFQKDANGILIGIPDLREETRGLLYRFAAGELRAGAAPNLRLATFEPNSSEVYETLLGVDVGVLPFPQHALRTPRSRVGVRPITVSVLGHQRRDKGFHLVPAFAAQVLQRRSDVRMLVHNGAPTALADVQKTLRHMAATEPRLRVDGRVADEEIWLELLDASDIIVCPYDPGRFAASYSAVTAEAIIYGIPLVVPANTALARLLEEFGFPGVTFAQPEPAAIAEAIEKVVDRFDDFAARAIAASAKWDSKYGPRRLVDAMLAMTRL